MAESHDIHDEHAGTAPEFRPDTAVKQIAARYAEALLDAAGKAGKTKDLLDEFDALVDVLGAFPKLESILASASIAEDEKVNILRFLKVISQHGQLNYLRAIHGQLHELHDRRHERVRVTLTTATEIDEHQAQRIAEALREKLGGEPVITRTTDPNLIGGVVVRVGDVVYDGSIANQLEIIRKQMIDRSVHEIQSGRDRFHHSEGN